MQKEIKVSIIVVNWNTRELLKKCLIALKPYMNDPDFEIIIVDNDSADSSADMVRQNFPQVKLIANNYNAMFAGGNNDGYRESHGRYIMLLNPDTEVQGDALRLLAEFLDSHPEAGGVAGKFINPDGSFQRYYNRWPTIPAVLLYNSPLPRRWLPKIPSTRKYMVFDFDFNTVKEIQQPAAAGIMVRRDIIATDPWLLDPIFPLLFNDVDLCKRIYDRGYKVFFLPKAVILHHHGGGGLNVLQEKKKREHKYTITYTKGFVDYLSKHHSWLRALIFKISATVIFALDLLLSGVIHIRRPDWGKEINGKARRLWEFVIKA